jgi:hypothetical protein
MKRLLLVVFLGITIGKLSAQNEYLLNNPEWSVLRGNGIFYPCIEYDSAHYFLNGDSLYNSNQWKVLWRCGHKWYSWQSPNPNTSCNGNYTYCDTIPTGLIRSQGKLMFFVAWNDTTQYLLYDFNMTIGSVPPVTMTYCCPVSDTVTAIDSFYTPYGYRKLFYLNNNVQPDFIEGVGSRFGLIEPFGPQLDQSYQLICYGLNDSAWFPTQGPYCDVITAGNQPAEPKIGIQLIPNPVSEIVNIQLSDAVLHYQVQVYNANGELVKQAFGVAELFVGDLCVGLYLVRVTSGDKEFTQRLVVE